MHPASDLEAALRRGGTRPLLTWYDDATGERVELSVATTANWTAKAANWLADERDVAPGGSVGLPAVDHWLVPVLALAAWALGCRLDTGAEPVVAADDLPAFQRAVLAQPDVLAVGTAPVEVPDPAYDVPRGARVLSTLPPASADGLALLAAMLHADGSLVVVAHAAADRLAATSATERASHTAGTDLPGRTRLV